MNIVEGLREHAAILRSKTLDNHNPAVRRASRAALTVGGVLGLSAFIAACGEAIANGQPQPTKTTTPSSSPTSGPEASPAPVPETAVQAHNDATKKNLADSMSKSFDGSSENSFVDANGHVYPDGTLVKSSIYNANTHKNSPFYNDYNIRNIGTILDDKGNPEYWILKVGNNKYLTLNFADMPKMINISTISHSGSAGNQNNPFYTPAEVANIVGNTDDVNVKGLAFDMGLNPATPQVNRFIKALQGHDTSPNLMTNAQVKDLINGKTTLPSTGLVPSNLVISANNSYLLNH